MQTYPYEQYRQHFWHIWSHSMRFVRHYRPMSDVTLSRWRPSSNSTTLVHCQRFVFSPVDMHYLRFRSNYQEFRQAIVRSSRIEIRVVVEMMILCYLKLCQTYCLYAKTKHTNRTIRCGNSFQIVIDACLNFGRTTTDGHFRCRRFDSIEFVVESSETCSHMRIFVRQPIDIILCVEFKFVCNTNGDE